MSPALSTIQQGVVDEFKSEIRSALNKIDGLSINRNKMSNNIKSDSAWIFHGEKGRFASGVFTSISQAEDWIEKHKLTGVLTEYPPGQSVPRFIVLLTR